ncbi:hypothetical protein EYF80_055928 [Liparis tanakae]|uniref:Uncharacterized protein n=1 Tax=Liparis tanakae TaxID=230148 RepID=A0A4Z2EYG8_9TELE|nr:hypothetical protein EYF80_055928 [Liparis tanakae]
MILLFKDMINLINLGMPTTNSEVAGPTRDVGGLINLTNKKRYSQTGGCAAPVLIGEGGGWRFKPSHHHHPATAERKQKLFKKTRNGCGGFFDGAVALFVLPGHRIGVTERHTAADVATDVHF